MQLTVVLICYELNSESYDTIKNIPTEIKVLVKCVSAIPECLTLIRRQKHISIIIQDDDGIYSAMNQALDAVDTEYVLFIGTNDIVSLDAPAILKTAFELDSDAYIFGVQIGERITKIENFGSIKFYHHQGTVMRTCLYVDHGKFSGFDIHADLALLNSISHQNNFKVTEFPGRFIVNYDIGGTSNSGDNAWLSIKELAKIFYMYDGFAWRYGHFKAILRPVYYFGKSYVGKLFN